MWYSEVEKELSAYHERYPLRSGLALATIGTKYFSRLSQKQLVALLKLWCAQDLLRLKEGRLSLANFSPQPSARQREWQQQLEAAYQVDLFNPPYWALEMKRLKVPETEQTELLLWLCEQGILTKTAEGIYFHSYALAAAREKLSCFPKAEGFTLAQARDALSTSRKYALSLLEYFDNKKITKRMNENRILL
jgi:selenocysteine-specific elongation factor